MKTSLLSLALSAALLATSGSAEKDPEKTDLSPSTPSVLRTWVERGPAPELDGIGQGIVNQPVTGAINAAVVAPNDPTGNTVYLAAVNGGIWKTTNANAATPVWKTNTDNTLPGLSFISIAVSPVNSQMVFAGSGSTSSYAGLGSAPFGVARSTDGGATWQALASATFAGRALNSIVPTTLGGGQVVLTASLNGGVYRSTDGGVNFTKISGTGGLPDQGVSSLVGDPGDPQRFYAGVPTSGAATAHPAMIDGRPWAEVAGNKQNRAETKRGQSPSTTGLEGVYTSTDGGVTWTAVNTGLTSLNTAGRFLLAVHHNAGASTNAVYAMIINGTTGSLQEVFRSGNHGAAWTSMAKPPVDTHPGGQGSVHGAIVADPQNANVIFLGGDRQDGGVNGCISDAMSAWRGNAVGNVWENVVCDGASGTAPHSDSRSMTFAPDGSIITTSDGGINRLLNPNTPGTRRWTSMNGNVGTIEMPTVAYDSLNDTPFGSFQDNGDAYQIATGDSTWQHTGGADATNVLVDNDQNAHPGTTIRYVTTNAGYQRVTYNANRTQVSAQDVGFLITSGAGSGQNVQAYDPGGTRALNRVTPARFLVWTTHVYESMDRGDTLANLGFVANDGSAGIAYGGRLNGVDKPDLIYVGAGSGLYRRQNLGDPFTQVSAYPGATPGVIVLDPQDCRHIYVLGSDGRIHASFNEGATWTDLTLNLPDLSPSVLTIEVYNPDLANDNTVLIAGGAKGVFQLRSPQTATGSPWQAAGARLPRNLTFDLHYDYTNDVLVAGTLGRGAWTISQPFAPLNLRITSIVRQPNGDILLEGSGAANALLTIQASPDLTSQNFNPIGTTPIDSIGGWQFGDTDAHLFPQRFYRATTAP